MRNVKNIIFIIGAVLVSFLLTSCGECDHIWRLTAGNCKTSKTCTICEMTDHTYNHHFNPWTAPTCEVAGNGSRTCTRSGCNHVDTRTTGFGALGHHFHAWTEPTCLVAGNNSRTCIRSGCNLVDTRATGFDALGHSGNWIVTDTIYPATSTLTSCTRCDVTGLQRATQIGDRGPGGGIIFYFDSQGFSVTSTTSAFITYTAYYLEAAPADMETVMRWTTETNQDLTFSVIGTERHLGSGRNNTALIIAAEKESFPDSTYIYAALACYNYTNNGQSDWFLPSIGELSEFCKQGTLFNFPINGWYWSSSQSQYAYSHAWMQTAYQSFLSNPSTNAKWFEWNNSFVRAIRAF